MELRRYWEIICRRKWILIQAVVIIPLLTLIFLKIIPPIYQSQSKLIFKGNIPEKAFFEDMPDDVGTLSFVDKEKAMGTILEILKSNSVVGTVIRDMDMRDKDGNLLQSKDFINPGKLKLVFIKKGVGIDNIMDSETFEITGYSNKKSEAKEIAQNVINAFYSAFSSIYKKEARRARKVIKSRLIDLEERLKKAEKELQDYNIRNRVFNINAQVTTLLTEISNLETLRNEALRTLQERKLNIESIRNADVGLGQEFKNVIVSIEDNTVVDNYKIQLITLQQQLAEMKAERTTEHPEVKTIQKQIDAVKESLKKEISKSFASQIIGKTGFYENLSIKYSNAVVEIASLKARENILNKQIKEKKNKLSEITEKRLKSEQITRTVNNLETAYNSMALNLETAKSAEEMDLSNAVLFQPPTLFENTEDNLFFPPKKKTGLLIISIFFATLFGGVLVFLLEYLDDSIKNPLEAEEVLNQKTIGTIPKIQGDGLAIEKIDNSPFLSSIYNILTNIKLFKGSELGKIISAVSPLRGEGKSAVAVFSAVALAQSGKKVLLIDGNLRYPSVHNFFNLPDSAGIADFLLENVEIQNIITSTSISNLDVITSGKGLIANPQQYLDSVRFASLLSECESRYDIILIDTPAVANGSDSLIVSRHADDILFITAQGYTSKKEAKKFMDTIKNAKMKVSGVILNKV